MWFMFTRFLSVSAVVVFGICRSNDDPSLVELRTMVQQQAQMIDQLQATVTALSSRVDNTGMNTTTLN
jgi:hypothetical protein